MREDARRIVVDDLDVRDEGRSRIEALEEIVRQQRVLRHTTLERRGERVDIVQALPRKNAFVEEILVQIGNGGRIRVHAGVAGVRASEERPRRARHRDADSRLHDAVAPGDAADLRVEVRTVQRMGDDADQLFRGVARQAGVGVERDAVAHCREHARLADMDREARVRGPSDQTVEFLELAPFTLPPHPRLFPRVPAPGAMAQKEAIGVLGAEPSIEILHSCARGRQDGRVLRQVF